MNRRPKNVPASFAAAALLVLVFIVLVFSGQFPLLFSRRADLFFGALGAGAIAFILALYLVASAGSDGEE